MLLVKDLPQLIVGLDSLNESANYIHIIDAKENTNYYCPCCKGLIKPRAYKKDKQYQVQPHYYHESGGCSEESFVHYICKTWLFEKGCRFKVNNIEYTVKSIETEKTLHTSFGDYRPDIIVYTESGKTFFFEIKYSNRKTELYSPKWDELGNDVVEVDTREFINNKYNCSIPEFRLIYSDGECFIKTYSHTDYEDTIAKRKLEWKRQDKLNYKIQWERLDWFWNKLYLFIHNESALDDVLESYKNVGYENIECCWHIVSKMSCIKKLKSSFRTITNEITNNYLKMSIDRIFNLTSSKFKINISHKIIPYGNMYEKNLYGVEYSIQNTFNKSIVYKYEFKHKELKWTILPSMIQQYCSGLNRNIENNVNLTLIKSKIEKSRFDNKDSVSLRNLYREKIGNQSTDIRNARICSLFKKFVCRKTGMQISCVTENNRIFICDKKGDKLPLSFEINKLSNNKLLKVCKDCINIISQLDFEVNVDSISSETSLTDILKSLGIKDNASYVNKVLYANGVFNPNMYSIALSDEYKWMQKYGLISFNKYCYGRGFTKTCHWNVIGAMWLSKNFNDMKKIYQQKSKMVKETKKQLQELCGEYKNFIIREGGLFSYNISLIAKDCHNSCELFSIQDNNFTFKISNDYFGDILIFDFEVAKTHMRDILINFMKDCEKYGLRFFRESEVPNDK